METILLDAKTTVRSPNFDQRSLPVSMLVLHYTGMKNAQLALERLSDPAAKVSAHYLVDEQGQIFAMVDEDKRAWHSGVSHWRGIDDVNSASIGVEIVNGGHDFGLPDFADAQITALIGLCQGILQRHAIHPSDIVGHNEIAPGRKRDPGEKFPWQRLAQAGIGLWPEIKKTPGNISQKQASKLLQAIGYPTSQNFSCLLSEFQRRYRPIRIHGQLDAQTIGLLQQLERFGKSGNRFFDKKRGKTKD